MDISSIFSNAFGYTKRMAADVGRLIILIVLSIIPIVNFIVAGYGAKVVREPPESVEPPSLKGYVDMWIQGLKIVVATIIWMIVPIVLISLGFGLSAAFYSYPATFGAWVVLGAVGVAVAFLIAIIMSMALVHMVKHDRFGKAFAIGEILEIIRRIGWGKYILWVVVTFVIGLVLSAIGNIPYVGWLISLIIAPLFIVFVARSASLIYSEGAPTSTATSGENKYCTKCGESFTPDAAFCPKCGEKAE